MCKDMYKDVHSIYFNDKVGNNQILITVWREIQYEIVLRWTNTKIIKLCLMKKHKWILQTKDRKEYIW